MHSVCYENQDVVIRIPRDAVSANTLSHLMDWLTLEEIRQQSRLSSADAEGLANEIKQSVWDGLKHHVR